MILYLHFLEIERKEENETRKRTKIQEGSTGIALNLINGMRYTNLSVSNHRVIDAKHCELVTRESVE